jgi:hypothetical protein
MQYPNRVTSTEICIGSVPMYAPCSCQEPCDCQEPYEKQAIREWQEYFAVLLDSVDGRRYLKLRVRYEYENSRLNSSIYALIRFDQLDRLIQILQEAKRHG